MVRRTRLSAGGVRITVTVRAGRLRADPRRVRDTDTFRGDDFLVAFFPFTLTFRAAVACARGFFFAAFLELAFLPSFLRTATRLRLTAPLPAIFLRAGLAALRLAITIVLSV